MSISKRCLDKESAKEREKEEERETHSERKGKKHPLVDDTGKRIDR